MELNHSLRCSCCEACLLNFISMLIEDQNLTLKIMPMYLKWSKWKMGSNFHHSSSLGFICASNNACWFSIPKLKANFQCQWWLGFFSLLCRKISSFRQTLDLIIWYKIKTSTFSLCALHMAFLPFFSVIYNISAPQTPTNKRINRCIFLENLALC